VISKTENIWVRSCRTEVKNNEGLQNKMACYDEETENLNRSISAFDHGLSCTRCKKSSLGHKLRLAVM
jgi:hypothetical protein